MKIRKSREKRKIQTNGGVERSEKKKLFPKNAGKLMNKRNKMIFIELEKKKKNEGNKRNSKRMIFTILERKRIKPLQIGKSKRMKERIYL